MSEPMYAFRNPDLPVEERAKDLLGRLTLSEKISQLMHASPAIERLGIPDYNWWNECLHGVARAGVATVFPQAIGLASTFDVPLIERAASAISDEARAKHHANALRGDHGIYKGLTFWTPNINIFRDPRWGRGQETYGECPYLTGRMGVAFVRGLQGNDPKYLKLVATPKHFAVHSGPEKDRHHFDAKASPKDLRETYLPAFRDCVIEARAESVMGAYNHTNGEPCCASPTLLDEILRKEWGFKGYVVSDCGAVEDFHEHHKITSTPEESAALAVREGCDLNCGCVYNRLLEALAQELVSEAEIDRCLVRLLCARIRLGMFDPPERVAYAQIPYEVVDCEEHRALALEAARKSIVLLKNERGVLPLSNNLGCIAVIGPNADEREMLWGNYNGLPSKSVTPLEGIRAAVSESTRVVYRPGCEHVESGSVGLGGPEHGFAEAQAVAETADAIVLCLGLTPRLEGEEGDASLSDAGGDRISIALPDVQQKLLERMAALGKPLVLVLLSGSALSVPWAQEHVPAILQQFYPGQAGGSALAEVLFGKTSPSGRLPVTVVRGLEQLPPFEDYAMAGRTYRYMEEEPLYPFGFGLGYSTFSYSALRVAESVSTDVGQLEVSVEVTNTGEREAEEVVQLYVRREDAPLRVPVRQLAGFRRVALRPKESASVRFEVGERQLAYVDENGRYVLGPGVLSVSVGGSQPDALSARLGAAKCVSAQVRLEGKGRTLAP